MALLTALALAYAAWRSLLGPADRGSHGASTAGGVRARGGPGLAAQEGSIENGVGMPPKQPAARDAAAPVPPGGTGVPRNWWHGFIQQHRYTWPIDIALIGALSLSLTGVQLWVDQRNAERQEVRDNVAFIRQMVSDHPGGPKTFQGLNLRGANLSGLDLGCDGDFLVTPASVNRFEPENESRCADFTGSDLTGAVITDTDLTGALLLDVVLDDSLLERVVVVGAWIEPRSAESVTILQSDLRGVYLARSNSSLKYPRQEPSKSGHLSLAAVDISGGAVIGQSLTLVEVTATGVRLSGGSVTCMGEQAIRESITGREDFTCGDGTPYDFPLPDAVHITTPLTFDESEPERVFPNIN